MKKIILTLSLSLLFTPVKSQTIFDDPEQLVNALYEEVTFKPGESPDWEVAKSMFLDDAIIVLRYGPRNMTVFDVQGWIDDFVTFIEEDEVTKTGFEEIILGKHSFIYGDIASINVMFESHIPGTTRKNKGMDIFQLIKKEGSWRIVSIINERPSIAGAIPDIY